MKKIIFIFCFIIISFPAFSNELQNVKPPIISNGISKKYDKEQLQKGFQIYNEICSSCHSMNHVRYKDLTQIGINWAKIKEISSNFEYPNGFDDEGEEKIRQGKPFDIIKNPYPNEKYARYINFGALPPDLSLIVKARKNGIYYINNFLNGFNLKPKNKKEIDETKTYNPYFLGSQTMMPPPFVEGIIEYKDGITPTMTKMSQDITAFLYWASYPNLEKRISLGNKIIFYLIILILLLFSLNKVIWNDINKK